MSKSPTGLEALSRHDMNLFLDGLQYNGLLPHDLTKLRQDGGEQSSQHRLVAEVIARVQPGKPAAYDDDNPGQMGNFIGIKRFRKIFEEGNVSNQDCNQIKTVPWSLETLGSVDPFCTCWTVIHHHQAVYIPQFFGDLQGTAFDRFVQMCIKSGLIEESIAFLGNIELTDYPWGATLEHGWQLICFHSVYKTGVPTDGKEMSHPAYGFLKIPTLYAVMMLHSADYLVRNKEARTEKWLCRSGSVDKAGNTLYLGVGQLDNGKLQPYLSTTPEWDGPEGKFRYVGGQARKKPITYLS